MKRIPIIVAVLMALMLCACSNSPNESIPDNPETPQTPSVLRVVSDVDTIEEGTTVVARVIDVDRAGEPIKNVLLKYEAAEDYGYDEMTFYLNYRGDGYQGEYNYVLYCPPIILDEFGKTGEVADAGSGNAFWWYAEKYFDLGINEIRNNWYAALNYLIGQDELPIPDASDFVESEWTVVNLEDLDAQMAARPVKGVLIDYSYENTFELTSSPVPVTEDGFTYNYMLTCPQTLCYMYHLAGYPDGGVAINNPFEWYVKTYMELGLNAPSENWALVFRTALEMNGTGLKGWDGTHPQEVEIDPSLLDQQLDEHQIIGMNVKVDFGAEDFRLVYMNSFRHFGNGRPYNYYLYYPEAIYDAYPELSEDPSEGDVFDWYLEEYINIPRSEKDARWPEILEKVLSPDVPMP